MGPAFAAGVISSGLLRPKDITVTDIDEERLAKVAKELGVKTTTDNVEAARTADVVLLAIKPALVPGVVEQIAPVITKKHLVISIAAGVALKVIQERLPEGIAVIRAMPNTPCQIGAGAIGFSPGDSADEEHIHIAKKIFDAVGISFEVPENLMNAITGLSGSGPAYVYLMIEALSDAGVGVGLSRSASLKLAAQTVYGAARMVLESGEHPAVLKDQVTSPAGTTIAAIDVLERAGLRSALMAAVKAATNRAKELA